MFRNLQQFSTLTKKLQIYDLAIITVPSIAPPYLPKFIFHKLRRHGAFRWLTHVLGCSRDREDREEGLAGLGPTLLWLPRPHPASRDLNVKLATQFCPSKSLLFGRQ